MFLKSILCTIFLVFFGQSALACWGGENTWGFGASLNGWIPNPTATEQVQIDEISSKIPIPIITGVRFRHSGKNDGVDCFKATMSFDVSLPDATAYSISDFGFYFRVKSGDFPENVIKTSPTEGKVYDNKMSVTFDLNTTRNFDAIIEIQPVTHALVKGPVTSFNAVKTNRNTSRPTAHTLAPELPVNRGFLCRHFGYC